MLARLNTVRSLVYNECQGNEEFQWVWDSHLATVERFARELAIEQGADFEVAMLGAYLHDIGRIKGDGDQEHDIAGVPIAEQIMSEMGYDDQSIQKVKGIILAHECRGIKPKTLEEKIVATADAMSHFSGDFYLNLLWNHKPRKTFEECIQSSLEKMEREFHNNIFFESARERVRPAYEALKLVFNRFTINERETTEK